MKDCNYYKKVYQEFWSKCMDMAEKEVLENGGDLLDCATEIFEELANAEQVVGYYICFYNEYALKTWLMNIVGFDLTEQDKEVTRLLEELDKNNYR